MIVRRFLTITVLMAIVCAQCVLAQESAVPALGPAPAGAQPPAYRAPAEGGVRVCGDQAAACCGCAEQGDPSCAACRCYNGASAGFGSRCLRNPGGLLGELICDDCGGCGCACGATEEQCGCGEEEPDCGCACDPPDCRWCCGGAILGDPWELPGPRFMQRLGVGWGGWVSAGIYGNAHGAAVNGPLGFNDVGDGFTFNQWWTYAERVADTQQRFIDWGFRVDFVFGVDGPDTQAFGGHPSSWDNPWDTARDYGFALPQLYGEVAFHNLRVKFGHFYTIIGWEVVPATGNFFYSHAYTMYYAEPFTHTGVLAEHPLGKHLAVYAGWTQGWDTGFDNTPGADTFLGGVRAALTDKMTFVYATTFGNFGANVAAGDVYMNSLVWEWKLTDRFTYILQHDLGTNWGNAAGDSQWYGINQYFQYQLNDCWAAGMRVEWFHDDDGARVPSALGRRGDYWELTWGLNWRPHANLVLRPEIRYDWFDGLAAAGDLPFDNGASADQFSGGFDLILTY